MVQHPWRVKRFERTTPSTESSQHFWMGQQTRLTRCYVPRCDDSMIVTLSATQNAHAIESGLDKCWIPFGVRAAARKL